MKKKSGTERNVSDFINDEIINRYTDSPETEWIFDDPDIPEDDQTQKQEIKSPGSFKPWENANTEVYGPPKVFSKDDHFNPEDNENELLYGPPEVFGFDRSDDSSD
jgi:hypothetical protein